ncbi:replicative DNA helicase [Nocardiopsis sp. NPDC057823]|uniref:replicative DNA helicase n=1 Tax=Nocardiopsis sp. NPDC057823 TaxID=3346256 RepID=UPI00366FAEFD
MANPDHDFTEENLPFDLPAEQAAVGAALLDETGQVLGQILEIASPAMFFRSAHGEILTVIRDLADQGKPHGLIAVNSELLARGRSHAVGGTLYLTQLTQAVPAVVNGPYFARKVADAHVRRQIIAAGVRMQQIGYSSDGDAEDLVALACDAPADLVRLVSSAEHDTFKSLADGFMEHMDGLEQGRKEVPVIPVPFADLQVLLGGGFARGQLVTIGALSGHGKTVLALDLARCAARAGYGVLVHSLEMSHEQIQERITSAETGIVSYRLRVRPDPVAYSAEEMERLAAYAGRVQSMRMDIDDASDVGLSTVRARISSMERQGRKPDLVVVDYLQLMNTTAEDRRDLELGRITRGLKLLAKDKGLCVILLAQIAKDVASRSEREDGRPKVKLEDFRESASIGHDSDISIMIENHNKTDPEGPMAGLATLHVVKNRQGSTGQVIVAVEFHYSRFTEVPQG